MPWLSRRPSSPEQVPEFLGVHVDIALAMCSTMPIDRDRVVALAVQVA